MKIILWVVSLGAALICLAGCSDYSADVADSAKKQSEKSKKFHGEQAAPAKDQTVKVAAALRKSRLNGYPKKSVGEAFDAYSRVVSKEWQEDFGKDGKLYVDYICWFDGKAVSDPLRKTGTVKTGLDVKFVIEENGDAYIAMASKLYMLSDGKVQSTVLSLTEVTKIVDAIYNDRALEL